jgi:hypothetical protein
MLGQNWSAKRRLREDDAKVGQIAFRSDSAVDLQCRLATLLFAVVGIKSAAYRVIRAIRRDDCKRGFDPTFR